jgi:formaldehyde-activating enzyme involved in methanogenesis
MALIFLLFWGYVMSDTIWFRTGEATVFASDGQGTDAMPEILIGSVKGPVGHAFANLMGQTAGHTRMFIVDPEIRTIV